MFTFLIKPTNACNLRCKYCFIQDTLKASSKIMSVDLAKKTIDKIAEFIIEHDQTECKIIWHGGEPLLWKASNYDAVLSYMYDAYPEISWDNAMQSNLTLLTDEHLRVIKKYDIDIILADIKADLKSRDLIEEMKAISIENCDSKIPYTKIENKDRKRLIAEFKRIAKHLPEKRKISLCLFR